MKKINIAIDGHSSCGKSTLAKQLSKYYSYIYVDTGAMYRAVCLYALKNDIMKDGIIEKDTNNIKYLLTFKFSNRFLW